MGATLTPDDMLRRLVAALESNRPVPADVSGWLLAAITRFRLEGAPLDVALELRRPGRRAALNHERKWLRDVFVTIAVQEIADEVSLWDRAGIVAKQIRRFQADTFPRFQHLDRLPGHFDRTQQALFHAAQCGSLPATQRQIYALVRPRSNKAD